MNIHQTSESTPESTPDNHVARWRTVRAGTACTKAMRNIPLFVSGGMRFASQICRRTGNSVMSFADNFLYPFTDLKEGATG